MNIQQKSIFAVVLEDLKKHIALYLIGFILMLISTGLALFIPIRVQDMINGIGNVNAKDIVSVVGIIMGSFICQSVSTYLLSVIGYKITSDIRTKAWKHTLYGEVSYLNTIHSGEITNSIINGALAITNFISASFPNMVIGVISIVASVIIMLLLDYTLTLIFLMLIPVILVTVFPISKKIFSVSESQQERLGSANSYFSEIITQIRLVKAYTSEQYEEQRGKEEIRKIYENGKRAAKINALLSPLMGGLVTLLLFSVIGIGAYRVNAGLISVGTVIAFFLYIYEAMEPVQSLGSFMMELQDLRGSTSKLVDLLTQENETSCIMPATKVRGNIVFENISFAYDEEKVLKNVSFVAEEGKRTAIVGESGSGKTTIISLLERFYSPLSGTIKIGDTSSDKVSLESWRKELGYVSQDSIIVTGTIQDNILYGTDSEVSEDEIIAASRMADIYDYIVSLPNQFHTMVGERGILLSGGQKQRIAIARALIRNPQYLLLDEATANLDSSTEEKVQDSINKLLKGRTSIIIAHRLSTIINVDKVIVLQEGKVMDVGTHQELILSSSYYSDLVHRQFLNNT